MIHWNRAELTNFFGVIPTCYEAANSCKFEIPRDGLRLVFTIFNAEGATQVSLFRDGLPEALISIRREQSTHIQLDHDSKGRAFLEVGAPSRRVSDPTIKPVLVRGFRIHLEPQFKIDLIEGRNA
jgi:hypothetical protein